MSISAAKLVCAICGKEVWGEEGKRACEGLGLFVPYYRIDSSVRFRGHISPDDYEGVDGKELTGIVYDIFFPKPETLPGYLGHDYGVVYCVRSDAALRGPDPARVIGAPMKVPVKVTRYMNEHDQLLYTTDGARSLASDWDAQGFPLGDFHKRVTGWQEWREEVQKMNPKPNILKRLDLLQALLVL